MLEELIKSFKNCPLELMGPELKKLSIALGSIAIFIYSDDEKTEEEKIDLLIKLNYIKAEVSRMDSMLKGLVDNEAIDIDISSINNANDLARITAEAISQHVAKGNEVVDDGFVMHSPLDSVEKVDDLFDKAVKEFKE